MSSLSYLLPKSAAISTDLSPGTLKIWHLTIVNPTGSPEHYFHFLLGFLVPLIYHLSTSWATTPFSKLLLRSCGPFDSILREFGDERITILDRDEHREMADVARSASVANAIGLDGVRFVTLNGWDDPAEYSRRRFATVRDILMRSPGVRSAIPLAAENWSPHGPRVLLIQRGPSPEFYHSDRSEMPGSGDERRSIPNHQELHYALCKRYGRLGTIVPERLSFSHQIALFSMADIIIAQHGAALANVIWARSDATVIEISPRSLHPKHQNLFSDLSRCMGQRYFCVFQNDCHSNVLIESVQDVVHKSITKLPNTIAGLIRPTGFRIARFIRLSGQMLSPMHKTAIDWLKNTTGLSVSMLRVLRDERIPKTIRRQVFLTSLRLHFHRRGKLPNPCNILGHKIYFIDESILKFIFREIFINFEYFFVSRSDTPSIVDCGSNIGLSILFFKILYPNAKILAFEPDPVAFSILTKNIDENALLDVSALRYALTDHDGNVEFYKPAQRSTALKMSIDRERLTEQVTSISVPARRLASLLPESVDLLKIDIEGAEEVVLGDLEKSAAFGKIDQLHLEYHHHIRPDRDRLARVLGLLESNFYGYQIRAAPEAWPTRGTNQDVAIYAYKKI